MITETNVAANRSNTFEYFLEEKHFEVEPGHSKDWYVDNSGEWMCNLDFEELCAYADEFARKQVRDAERPLRAALAEIRDCSIDVGDQSSVIQTMAAAHKAIVDIRWIARKAIGQ
jgi:hypothetical protein